MHVRLEPCGVIAIDLQAYADAIAMHPAVGRVHASIRSEHQATGSGSADPKALLRDAGLLERTHADADRLTRAGRLGTRRGIYLVDREVRAIPTASHFSCAT
jgi:hypothetical protein